MNESPPRALPPENNQENRLEQSGQDELSPELNSEVEIMDRYQSNRAAAETKLETALKERAYQEKLSHVRESLGLNSDQDSAQKPHEIDTLEAEIVRAQANYPGNWTLLLEERLRDPNMREKFVNSRTEALGSMREGEPGPFDKEKQFRSHYERQLDTYDENIDSVLSRTMIGNASEFGKKPVQAGSGNIGEPGTVFLDAVTREGTPLTTRQKMIIEAHEKGHGVRDFQGSDAIEIRSVLDPDILKQREDMAIAKDPQERFANYLSKPEEIVERMAQLKNYFGFKGNEPFTKKHLDYAKEHYIEDTGLDNTMGHFFAAITPETEDRFLEVMNKYPI